MDFRAGSMTINMKKGAQDIEWVSESVIRDAGKLDFPRFKEYPD